MKTNYAILIKAAILLGILLLGTGLSAVAESITFKASSPVLAFNK
jgi:hypothetical protein